MLRVILYLAFLAPILWSALWLADHPGNAVMEWFGYRIETSLGVLLASLSAAVIALLMTALVIRSILGVPSNIRASSRYKRQQQGLIALTQAMSALAIADHRAAEKYIKRAAITLNHAPATLLLSAQLAHAKGDQKSARKCLDHMMDSPETRLVALRGMIEQSVREGKVEQAIRFAKEAWNKQPKDRWLSLVLIDLLSREMAWADALEVVAQANKSGAMSREDTRRYYTVIQYERAQQAIKDKTLDKASNLLEHARKRDDSFLPAQTLAVDMLANNADLKACFKLIQQFWKDAPQAHYVDLILHHYSDETAPKLQKRFEKLIALNPDHVESQLAMARCAIHLAKWDLARNYLKVALTKHESSRIYELLAEVEKNELGDDKQASEWLRRAVTAPKDPAWNCNRCNHRTNEWHIHCEECGSFDSYIWQTGNTGLGGGQEAILPPALSA